MEKKDQQIIILALSFLLILYPALALSQGSKDKTAAQKIQSEVATDSDTYIIGPEDILHIHVWKEETLTKTVPVRMDGKISLPLVDDIQAADLTPLQLKKVIIEKLKGFIDNPTVSVTVMEVNSFKVYVVGEVKTTGAQKLRTETSFVQLITMAGGFTDWADQKKILIIRKQNGVEKRIKVNYKKIINGKEPDITMKRGDIVVVSQ